MKIGLIGIVAEDLERDFVGTLERVAAIGYQGMEYGLSSLTQASLSLAEIRQRSAGLGLATVNIHIGPRNLEEDFSGTVRVAQQVGCSFLTIAWGPVESAEQVRRDAATYDRFGAQCRDEGLTLCYHNHDHEMRRLGGQHALDILLDNSDPQHLQSQLDVCWVRFGGADPVDFLHRLAGRVPLVHLKDVARLEPGSETGHGNHETMIFTEVGTGIVDFPAVFAAACEAGSLWATVEQDRMRHLTTWESITCSYLNLKARGLA